jgi:DNA-damage-inducible protein D
MTALTYTEWRNFTQVVTQARIACDASGHEISDHFVDINKMVTIGSGARRRIADVRLSRYACYLIIQNADPEKPIVALGQTYFAVQTRRQELSDEQLLANMSEDQRRLFTRQQLVERNKLLAATATTAGVITSRDFAVFQDHGYMGLYNGERARDIAMRKGLKPGGPILDHMGAEELAANLFRATQAEAKIRRESVTGKDAANATHHAVGREVRETIARLGGTMPEDLPAPSESIQQLDRKERERLAQEGQRRRQPPLFSNAAHDELAQPDEPKIASEGTD